MHLAHASTQNNAGHAVGIDEIGITATSGYGNVRCKTVRFAGLQRQSYHVGSVAEIEGWYLWMISTSTFPPLAATPAVTVVTK